MIPEKDWHWCGFPGHFILANKCLFHLNTRVGKYRVSTVGWLRLNEDDTEFADVGADKFESMVFELEAEASEYEDACEACRSELRDAANPRAVRHYGTVNEANAGHRELCQLAAAGEL